MKTILKDYIFGVLVILLYSACTDCTTTNFDTYEIDEEPLSFAQDQNQLDSVTTYQLDSAQHKVLDLALVFDASYTITTSGWYKIKKAAKQLVDSLDIAPQGTHVSLMKYSTDVETFRIFEQDDDKDKIKKQIEDLTYDGEWSRMDLAAKAVDEHVFASDSGARLGDVPKAVVFFTDGRTDGQTQPDEEVDWHQRVLRALKPLHDKNVIVYAVAVGGLADRSLLAEITGSPPPNATLSDQASESKVFELSGIDDLVKSLDKLSVSVPKVVITSTVVMTTVETSTPVTKVTATVTTTKEVPPSSPAAPASSQALSPSTGETPSVEPTLSSGAASSVQASSSEGASSSAGASISPSATISPAASSSAVAPSSGGASSPPASSSAGVSESASAGASSSASAGASSGASSGASAGASSSASAGASASSSAGASSGASAGASSSASAGASASSSAGASSGASAGAFSSASAGASSGISSSPAGTSPATSSPVPSSSAGAATPSVSPSPQASPSGSLSASATPGIAATTVAETITITTTIQVTQSVLHVGKGTPILITAEKKRLKRSIPSKWYHRIMPRFFKRWLQVED